MGQAEGEPFRPEIRPPAPAGRQVDEDSSPTRPPVAAGRYRAPIEEAPRDHRVARTALTPVAVLAATAWLLVGLLVVEGVQARSDREGLTTFSIAIMMPFVLVPALGLTAAAAYLYQVIRGGRAWSAIAFAAIVAAALLTPCVWWGVLARL